MKPRFYDEYTATPKCTAEPEGSGRHSDAGKRQVRVKGFVIDRFCGDVSLLDGAPEGALSKDGPFMASYCHGRFAAPQALSALLEWVEHKPGRHFDLERLAERLPLKSIHQAKEGRQ